MDIIQFRDYCLTKKGVTESTPFGEDTLVFKVMGKMFALCSMADFTSINLKCEPEKAVELREEFPEIKPGFHMSKRHWNTVSVLGNLPDHFLCELIDHSYAQVVAGLPAKIRFELLTN